MPLMSSASQIKGLAQSGQPAVVPEGSLWYDSTNDLLKASDGSTFNQVGKTSFSSAAVVSQSTTIGDYTVPSSAYDLNYTSTSYDHVGDATTNKNPYGGGTVLGAMIGIKIIASSPAIGTTIKKVKCSLSKRNTPTDTTVVRVYDANDVLVATSTTTLDESTLTGTLTTFEFTFANGVALGLNYRVVVADSNSNTGVNNPEINTPIATVETGYKTTYGTTGAWTDITTTNVCMTFDSTPTGTGQPPTNIYDTNIATRYTSAQSVNPAIYVDMNSASNLCAVAFYWDGVNTTETQILIQTSIDATTWVTKRTVTTSGLTTGAWNYYRFNIGGGHRYVRFYGNSGSSSVLSIYEVKVLTKTDAQVLADLGILEISTTSTSLTAAGT